jgi:DNA-binding LytR/AlgR family response regulator
VNVEDLIAIRPTADGPEFDTMDATYYYPTTLEELHLLFKDIGFERLDRTNLVNLNHVKAFDPKARKVFFEHPYHKDSKFATVSEANVHKVNHLIREKKDAYETKRKPLLGFRGNG